MTNGGKYMDTYVLDFQETGRTKLTAVGGKGANLGELSRIKGIRVPDGFCVTTDAYKKITENNQELNGLLDELTQCKAEQRSNISEISAKIRTAIERTPISKEIEDEIIGHLNRFDERDAFAVRSSATAEDLPAASFAGQQDTYLNIIGKESILMHIGKCWASLFTDRAVVYRIQNGFDHRQVYLSVIIQRMIFPQASGILFTADPVTSNRRLVSIDASFGLGEALVSGLVSADGYKVQQEQIVAKAIATKKLGIYALQEGGTKTRKIEPDRQKIQTLTDQQILQLAQIGRQIEAYFGHPQDIEWCLADDTFYIVQSRPITTLYPIPEAGDEENHVYVSVGHQQMMTDPIKPLGLSFFLLTTNAPMRKAGGRLFVDITRSLASPVSRKKLINVLGPSDPLIKDALTNIVKRKDFFKSSAEDKSLPLQNKGSKVLAWQYPAQFENNPKVVSDLIERSQASLAALKQNIQKKSGADLFDFILEDIQQLKKILFSPESLDVIMVAMHASTWINKKMLTWLGEKNAADTLSQSVSNNITSQMGLELLDLADVIRPHWEVIEHLQHINDNDFLDELLKFDGGGECLFAIQAYLNKYGMRCPGEIDITRTRWTEKPATLVPVILSNIKNFDPKAGKLKFEHGLQEALKKSRKY